MNGNEEMILGMLVDVGLIKSHDIDEARPHAASKGVSILDALVSLGKIGETDVTKAVANMASMEFVESLEDIAESAIASMPRQVAKRYKVIPIQRFDSTLRVAISNPFDLETIDSLTYLLKLDIEPVVAPQPVIDKAIGRYYSALGEDPSILADEGTDSDIKISSDDKTTTADAPIIKLVHLLIIEAYRARASDIHIEPLEKKLRVRYRIDGVLQEMQDPPKRLQSAIISRLKIMSNMSIAEKRLPQDGRIQIKMPDKDIDLRVSTVPTNHGESIVMRILDKTSLMLGLPELGFLSDDQVVMERILGLADGIFLVTGPTGSGKTTTLYACLNYLNKSDRKLITVEDPVEYILKGVNQVQVNEDVGMGFAAALRSMLRQAPNIIMVGEIRDMETANIAINASLTGHLVFSTLHTNDAPSAITRLVDIGVKPFLVASSLRAVMAQRLVRVLCKKCKAPHEATEAELKSLGLSASQALNASFMHAVGCDSCRGTGYRGRAGIFEIFNLNDEVRRMINDRVSSSELAHRARQLGMRSLREDGVRKVLAGMTSVEEVVSATAGDKS